MIGRAASITVILILAAQVAQAGAWTMDRNQFEVYAGAIASTASRRFDNEGGDAKHIMFNKLLLQSWMEYGVTDAVTIFAAPEYVLAKSDMTGTGATSISSRSIEGGLRILLLSKIGMLSIQTSAKSAGAFGMSVSADREAGHQFETRLLYGRSFTIFGQAAFVDIEAAERWIARPRPNEFAFDGTAGCWVTSDYLVLIQSFNFVTRGPVKPPFVPYRLSKLQFSLVDSLTRRWSVQSGYFLSLSGRNIVKETGVITTIWFRT